MSSSGAEVKKTYLDDVIHDCQVRFPSVSGNFKQERSNILLGNGTGFEFVQGERRNRFSYDDKEYPHLGSNWSEAYDTYCKQKYDSDLYQRQMNAKYFYEQEGITSLPRVYFDGLVSDVRRTKGHLTQDTIEGYHNTFHDIANYQFKSLVNPNQTKEFNTDLPYRLSVAHRAQDDRALAIEAFKFHDYLVENFKMNPVERPSWFQNDDDFLKIVKALNFKVDSSGKGELITTEPDWNSIRTSKFPETWFPCGEAHYFMEDKREDPKDPGYRQRVADQSDKTMKLALQIFPGERLLTEEQQQERLARYKRQDEVMKSIFED